MKKQFATYEIALAIKELGFNEFCLVYLTDDEYIWCPDEPCCNSQFLSKTISITLWQQVIDWCDSKGLLVGTIIVDNLYKSTINKINYETELFHSRNESIKQAIAFAIGYLQDNK